MKKSDLKDGMVVTYRNGEVRILIGEVLYEGLQDILETMSCLKWFNCDMTHIGDSKFDIMKVEYMNEVLWQRVEYVDFMTAVNSGKKFKHASWKRYITLVLALQYLSDMQSVDDIKKLINSKEWMMES